MNPVLKRTVITLGAVLFALVFIAMAVMLYVNVRLQQSLLSRTPQYTGEQLYSKAVDQVEKGQYKEAEGYLEQALAKEDDATYRNQLAVVKYRLKKYDEAIVQYKKLVDLGKDPAFAYNGIGNAYRDWAEQDSARKAEYQQKAIDAYNQAITVNAAYPAAYSNLALLLASQGKKDEAIMTIDKGITTTQLGELRSVKTSILGQ